MDDFGTGYSNLGYLSRLPLRTPEQAHRLALAGCDTGQGRLYAKAAPWESLEPWLVAAVAVPAGPG